MKTRPAPTRIAVAALAALLAATAPAAAGELSLAWSAPTDHVTAGFEVEVLDMQGHLLRRLDVGDATSIVVTDLTDDTLYRFRLRSYDQWGHVSRQPSQELVTFPKPRVDAIAGEIDVNRASRVSVEGTNFADGAWAVSLVEDVIIEDTVVIRPDLAIVTVVAAAPTTLEPADLLVVNPVRKAEAFIAAHPQVVDLDRSGSLDARDLEAFSELFGVSTGHPSFRPELDPTGDGVIDGEDLAMLKSLLARGRTRVRAQP